MSNVFMTWLQHVSCITFILFKAFALLKVPELQFVVQGAGQDVAAVGRKLHKRDRRVGLIYERFEALATIAVPYPTKAIIAAGYNQGAISVEVYSCNGIRVCR